jgi:hypothetical protein
VIVNLAAEEAHQPRAVVWTVRAARSPWSEQLRALRVGRELIPIGSDLHPSTVRISRLRTACVDGGLARSTREQVMEKLQAQLPRGKLVCPSVSDSRRAWELRGALPERVKALNEKRLQSKAPLGGFVTFVPSLAFVSSRTTTTSMCCTEK